MKVNKKYATKISNKFELAQVWGKPVLFKIQGRGYFQESFGIAFEHGQTDVVRWQWEATPDGLKCISKYQSGKPDTIEEIPWRSVAKIK
jgi:hypothetical protein